VTGDFNTTDTDPIFKDLQINANTPLPSLRNILSKDKSDNATTFNGFNKNSSFKRTYFSNLVVIDHIFVKLTDLAPVKLEVLRDEIVSDHYPIVGYFQAIEE
jgi:endonuclease/exonuclease/phosphatase family metal-dependent hydrolase